MDSTNDNNVKVARIPGSRAEFVFNSGRGARAQWWLPPLPPRSLATPHPFDPSLATQAPRC